MEPGQFGKAIRRLRELASFTQEELAGRAEIAPRVLQRIESGRANPKIGTLQEIARALGCSIRDFYEDKGVPTETPQTVADLSPDELVERLSKVISITPAPGELVAAWREAREQWQRDFALFVLTGEVAHLKKVSPEIRKRLEKGLYAFGMKPEKARASKK